jgi:hypothetical protein
MATGKFTTGVRITRIAIKCGAVFPRRPFFPVVNKRVLIIVSNVI